MKFFILQEKVDAAFLLGSEYLKVNDPLTVKYLEFYAECQAPLIRLKKWISYEFCKYFREFVRLF